MTKRVTPTVAGLLAAIRTVNHYHDLGDAVYDVRERHGGDNGFTGDSWTHPKVIAFSTAVENLREMTALDPIPEKPITPKVLTATLVGEAFGAYRFQVDEEGKDGRAYVAEVPILQAAATEASEWWGSRGNKEMARFEAIRWAEVQALQKAARAFAEAVT